MSGQIFFRGSYSGDQLSLIGKVLQSDDIFLDIGANQGEFTICAAGIVHDGQVISFEPVSEYRARLLKNINLNDLGNVKVVPVALGDKEGVLPVFDTQQRFSDGTRHEGLASLFSSESRNHAREVVRVRRLDDVLRELQVSRVDVIKLDIEGAEWMALRGAENTLAHHSPTLILEIGRDTCRAAGYEPEAFVEWLTGMGYRIEIIIEGGQTVPIGQTSLGGSQNVIAYRERTRSPAFRPQNSDQQGKR